MTVFIKQELANLSQDDLEALIHLDHSFFDYPWSRNQWLDLRKSDNYLLIFDKQKGLCLFQLNPFEGMAHLLKILVIKEERRKGVAQFFINSAIEQIKAENVGKIILEVADDNLSAIEFYQKNGFEGLNVVKKYYSDGKNALRMIKEL